MRWEGQALRAETDDALPALARLSTVVRTVQTPEFAGITFHEVLAKSALNRVGPGSAVPFTWTINPYRGCSHACAYCFARPSHRYLELDAGRDFDSQIVVKINIVDALRRDLAKPSWEREHVALGTNTDPYQRAEGRYRLMPGIVRALADAGTPLSILTKGSLLRRDLPLLAAARESVPVDLGISIAIVDDELQQAIEPGTPTAQARLATVAAAAAEGFEVAVFMMPVLPFLTDSEAHLDAALARIKEAGASSVTYTALHLRPGVKEWFAQYLHAHRPDLIPRYRELYGDGAYAPKEYRRWLASRIRPIIAKHGLARAPEDPNTGSVASRANARDDAGEWRRAAAAPSSAVDPLTLF
ncbi:Rv2578c family radical SAM protein [Demequina sp. SYSU T00039]|uniref:Rv2578c family radical SAM protein n=1 Tax=Demequina lignilytica TaxID=3051663 RepID=A0AAW7M222_9MICO|nr:MULTISPECIES: Rv2578c family radical SAM protein [unclassified Demequina]MDN4477039.1 Rv2578c family radical SAM protein [Demequina sp. SYSU T00039-1]MDN4487212.1 Rv2578c family radical SAM protein [Demequina sp. SYSU T00039]MDN4491793.1 Rv2578c family radical SAM protein [Demequina sp. SYSU T00068]